MKIFCNIEDAVVIFFIIIISYVSWTQLLQSKIQKYQVENETYAQLPNIYTSLNLQPFGLLTLLIVISSLLIPVA
jgi:TRAP-type C4-dicarboxylate transport system permease small subunit